MPNQLKASTIQRDVISVAPIPAESPLQTLPSNEYPGTTTNGLFILVLNTGESFVLTKTFELIRLA